MLKAPPLASCLVLTLLLVFSRSGDPVPAWACVPYFGALVDICPADVETNGRVVIDMLPLMEG